MNSKILMIVLLMAFTVTAQAVDTDDIEDISMQVMDADQNAGDGGNVARELTLPPSAVNRAKQRAGQRDGVGLSRANEIPLGDDEALLTGQETAEQARQAANAKKEEAKAKADEAKAKGQERADQAVNAASEARETGRENAQTARERAEQAKKRGRERSDEAKQSGRDRAEQARNKNR